MYICRLLGRPLVLHGHILCQRFRFALPLLATFTALASSFGLIFRLCGCVHMALPVGCVFTLPLVSDGANIFGLFSFVACILDVMAFELWSLLVRVLLQRLCVLSLENCHVSSGPTMASVEQR